MCSMSVLCPLCNQTSFSGIDALRSSLIKAANGPLPCPICNEVFLGLDKLTIHLFSHTALMEEQSSDSNISAAPNTSEMEEASENSSLALANNKLKTIYAKKRMKKTKQPLNASTNSSVIPPAVNSESGCMPSPISCDICEFTFSTEQLRDMHVRLVHQNLEVSSVERTFSSGPAEPFKCHLCSKTFKNKGSLRVHLKVVHMLGLPYSSQVTNPNSKKLNICDRLKVKDSNQQHFHPTSNETHTLTLLSNNSTSGNSSSPLTGPGNAFTFGTLTILPNQPQANPLAQLSSPSETKSILNINSNGDLVHSNDLTSMPSNVLLVFNPSPSNLLTSQTNPPALPTIQNDLDSSQKNSSLVDNPKIWECDICSKSFTTKYFLKKHKRLHTGEMPYTCELCSRTFTFQQSYHKHLLYHSEVKPHVCSTCGRAFKELSTLHNHERIHSGEKPFKCEVCGKSFRQRVSFLVHTRIHTGVMPYKCDVCQKSFRYKVSQRTHKCLPQIMTNNTPKLPISEDANASGEIIDQPTNDNASHDDTSQLSETFIKTFLEQATSVSQHSDGNQNSPASLEISAINEEHASLVKAIDDYVAESCQHLTLATDQSINEKISDIQANSPAKDVFGLDLGDGSNSPSQQLQRMRLYSPQMCNNEMGNSDNSFECFLMNNVGNNLL